MSTRRRHTLIATLAVLGLLAPRASLAEPAVVALFEAVARAEPKADAAPVQTLVEGTAVSVSEEATAGWRRLRLADGKTAWIEERALAFPARGARASPPAAAEVAPPPAPWSAPPAPPPPPDLRARVYVKDLDHLAELVKDDARAGPMASRLASRRTTAYTLGGIGLVTSVALVIYGSSQASMHSSLNDPKFGQTGDASGAFVASAVTGLATAVAMAAFLPSQSDLLDVINTWNVGHPSDQFTLGEHHLEK